ncbi:hypothetical protein [Actinomadura rayongensis]|uniref:Sensor domain-containing protein n=1 Tax=Actinomadura rayongensis TaxID=1429076 RepID=A0A6I4WJZ2_9ACTN|nr:hypothetical protein [Actinomadura rayongensis]MXQ66932.1 hypothetical protein [Actinomadura rayongensis]
MTRRILPVLLLATAATASGCGGDGGGPSPASTARAQLGGAGYTAAQLEQALITDLPGYRRAGAPDSGEYGALRSVQHFRQLQRAVKVDRPDCARTDPAAALDAATPAAIVSFTKGGGVSVTETLLSLPDDQAARLVGERTPAGCRTFTTTVGAQKAEHRVVEPPPGTIGQGSRTVGVTTVSGNSHTKTWYVVLRGRRTVTTISLFGPVATRADAEDIARRADEQARRILS